MEPRFGVDFSHVHVHTGSDAIHMNRDVGAQAFTHGSDIYFGEGHSPTNLALTAHELTHVIQQTGGVAFTQAISSVQRQQQKEAGEEGSALFLSYRHEANQREYRKYNATFHASPPSGVSQHPASGHPAPLGATLQPRQSASGFCCEPRGSRSALADGNTAAELAAERAAAAAAHGDDVAVVRENHAVARLVVGASRAGGAMLVRAPVPGAVDLDPGRFLEKHPELVEGKKRTEKKAPEHATRSDATSYESQPEALREVLERSFPEVAFSWFSALSDEARSNLVYTYNRMVSYGIWGHIRVIKSVEAGEKPVHLGPLRLYVAGKSQSILFDVYDGRALRDTMLGSGKFGKDVGPTGALHAGQTSMREWTTETVDGLHLSIGGGTEADAHIDKRSPTNKPRGQVSQMDLVRSLEHHWQEVWPEFLRAGPGWLVRVPQHVYEWLVDKLEFCGAGERLRAALKEIPKSLFDAAAHAVGLLDALWAGTTFKPGDKVEHPDPSQREESSDIVVVKEYRFGGGKGKDARLPVEAPAAQSSLDEELTAAVSRAVSIALPGIVKPSGRHRPQDDYADTETVGWAIAGKIMFQAKAGGQTIEINLGTLYHDLSQPEVAEVQQQLATIGKAAREGLAAALNARQDEDLAQRVLAVKSGSIQLGPSPVWFPLH